MEVGSKYGAGLTWIRPVIGGIDHYIWFKRTIRALAQTLCFRRQGGAIVRACLRCQGWRTRLWTNRTPGVRVVGKLQGSHAFVQAQASW
jgi:hypothetical protein